MITKSNCVANSEKIYCVDKDRVYANMNIEDKQFLREQYLMAHRHVLDAWFALKILYSKLAKSYDEMCQKFFEKPVLKEFGHTQRYCIIKQYKPVPTDLFAVLNKGFPAGREFSEPLFFERFLCEYYTPEKMCIVNGCNVYSFNRQYFENLQKFQTALFQYKLVLARRDAIRNKMSCNEMCMSSGSQYENIRRSVTSVLADMVR